MKIIVLLSVLASHICFSAPITIKGMPTTRVVSKDMAEVLGCRFQSASLTLELTQNRKADEKGIISIWSRENERATYADIFDGNFDYKRTAALSDRLEVRAAKGSAAVIVKFVSPDSIVVQKHIGNQMVLNETTSVSNNCNYTIGQYDKLFHRFK